MPWAVKVFERIRRRQVLELGRDIRPEDYVFMLEAASRESTCVKKHFIAYAIDRHCA